VIYIHLKQMSDTPARPEKTFLTYITKEKRLHWAWRQLWFIICCVAWRFALQSYDTYPELPNIFMEKFMFI